MAASNGQDALPTTVQRRLELRRDALARYERMVEIRELEDRILKLFADGLIPGTTHTCQGQEAVAVAIAAATEPTDQVTCTYRGHGTALALGMEPLSVVGEVMGRTAGVLGGLGGSMHLADPDIGLLPTFAIVGAGIPVAVGATIGARSRGIDAIGISICGDGATNIGAFHEGLNLAAVWHVPTLFVIENNLYGEFSPLEHTTPITDLHLRGASYGMASSKVDGQDVEALLEVMRDEVDQVRRTGEPRLLEVKTYRYVGHSRSDPATYRREGELDEWLQRDPLLLAKARLLAAGATEADLDALDARTRQRVSDAIQTALDSEYPPMGAMFDHVFVDGVRR
jgi:TPP-dependent pyruvate/acetoin dehydrogenase alpha subunit